MPVLTFNFKEGAVSEIDNRELAANPFSEEARETGDLTENTENYVNDRIGLIYRLNFKDAKHELQPFGISLWADGSGSTSIFLLAGAARGSERRFAMSP